MKKPNNYNIFTKRLSEYFKQSGVDWRERGSFHEIASNIYSQIKKDNEGVIPGKEKYNFYLNNIESLYESLYIEVPEEKDKCDLILDNFQIFGWWELQSSLYDMKKYLNKNDVIWFEGYDYMPSFDLSDYNNENELWNFLKSVIDRDTDSSLIYIKIDQCYKREDGSIVVILDSMNLDDVLKDGVDFEYDITDYGDRDIITSTQTPQEPEQPTEQPTEETTKQKELFVQASTNIIDLVKLGVISPEEGREMLKKSGFLD